MNEFSDRQKQIISKSMELIADKGIQGFTIRNLSGEIGISEPAIYRHFDSKVSILLGILSYFRESSLRSLEKILSSDETALKQLELLFLDHFQRFKKEPDLSSVIFSEEIFQDDKRLSDEIFFIMSMNRKVISDIVEKGQERKEIRQDISGDHLSLIITGTLRLIIKNWRLSDFSLDLEKEGISVWNSLEKLLKGVVRA